MKFDIHRGQKKEERQYAHRWIRSRAVRGGGDVDDAAATPGSGPFTSMAHEK